MQRKRIFGLLFVSILLVSLVAGFVSAQDVFDPVTKMFTSWQDGDLSVNLAKYVIWFILILMIYSVLGFIPMIGKGQEGQKRYFVNWVLAILVGFLASAYLSSSDIYSILASYGALGFILGAILPFIILLFFSTQMSKEGGPGGRIFAKVVWIVFILFLVWKVIFGMFSCSVGGKTFLGFVIEAPEQCISFWGGFGYIAVIIGILLYLWFGEKVLLKMFFKEELGYIQDKGKEDIAASLTAEINRREARSQELSGSAKKSYDRKTEELRAELKRVEGI